MADKRATVTINADEKQYQKGKFTRTNDDLIDNGSVSIPPEDPPPSSFDTVKVYDSTKTNKYFEGKITQRSEDLLYEYEFLGNGYELTNKKIQKVYTNTSPEAIVQDIVDNFTTKLTYVSTATSGVTIPEYVADAYLIDVINDMTTVLGWQRLINADNEFRFTPETYFPTGQTLINNEDGEVTEWKSDSKTIVNNVIVTGGFSNFSQTDSLTGTSDTFNLTKKPSGNMTVTDGSGTKIPAEDYKVRSSQKTVEFDNTVTDPTFEYNYERPIIVRASIGGTADANTVEKNIEAPWLNDRTSAQQYAKEYLKVFSKPAVTVTFKLTELNFDLEPGELIRIQDPTRKKDRRLVITKAVHDFGAGQTTLTLGRRKKIHNDWQRGIERRIKKIERRNRNEDVVTFSRFISDQINIELQDNFQASKRSVQNTFYLNHKTLSRVKEPNKVSSGEKADYEADCTTTPFLYGEHKRKASTNPGEQFNLDGWRLSYVDMSKNQEVSWSE